MNHRALYVLALMLIFAIPIMPGYAAQNPYFAANSYWGFNSTILTAYPGAYNMPLTVQVRYIGPVTLYNVSLKLVPGFPITPARGQGNVTLFIPELTPGTTITMFGLFNVSPKANVMVYNESVSASYVMISPYGVVPVSQLVNYSLPVTGFYGVKLAGFSTYPTVIYSGERAGELKASPRQLRQRPGPEPERQCSLPWPACPALFWLQQRVHCISASWSAHQPHVSVFDKQQ